MKGTGLTPLLKDVQEDSNEFVSKDKGPFTRASTFASACAFASR